MRRLFLRATLAIAASLALSPVVATAGTTGEVAGVVLDRQTGAPIADATVSASSASQVETTRSDARGDFVFASLNPGEYAIAGSRNGYWPAGERVVVRADAALHLALALVLKTPAPDVYVTSRASGDLVKPGTTINIDCWAWPPWPESPETSDISVYRAVTYDGYVAPWSNGFFIQMTPSITFGAGAPVMH